MITWHCGGVGSGVKTSPIPLAIAVPPSTQ